MASSYGLQSSRPCRASTVALTLTPESDINPTNPDPDPDPDRSPVPVLNIDSCGPSSLVLVNQIQLPNPTPK